MKGEDSTRDSAGTLRAILLEIWTRARTAERINYRMWLLFGYFYATAVALSVVGVIVALSLTWRSPSLASELRHAFGNAEGIGTTIANVVWLVAISGTALWYVVVTQLGSREKVFFSSLLVNSCLSLWSIGGDVSSLTAVLTYRLLKLLVVVTGVIALKSAERKFGNSGDTTLIS